MHYMNHGRNAGKKSETYSTVRTNKRYRLNVGMVTNECHR